MRRFFFTSLIVTLFNFSISSATAFSYTSADIPVGHWSYEAAEKLAMGGLTSLSGLNSKPMSRIQMAYKIEEAMDNIEKERIPAYLCFDREHIEYLQTILYKLINEFRKELILIGVTTVQIENTRERGILNEGFDYALGSPIDVEQRFANLEARKDILLENENGFRVPDGYSLRTRGYAWASMNNIFTQPFLREIGFAFSAKPALIVAERQTKLFFDEVAAKFSFYNIEVALAKSAMWWGSGYHGSLLLSNNAKPLNVVRVNSIKDFRLPWVFEHMGDFGIDFFVSRLEKDRVIPKPKMAGLRIIYSPLPCFTVSANRVSIMNGQGRPKLALKDYWKIFIARGKDEFSPTDIQKTDSDQLASFDARFVLPLRPEARLASGVEVYGEWAGEDRFSFWENESPAFMAGFFLSDLLRDKGTDLRVEYALTKPGWYNHGLYNASRYAGTAYTHEGEIMGHHMGGDADDLFFRISKELPYLSTPYFNFVKAGCQMDFERHGLNSSTGIKEEKIEFVGDILWSHADNVELCLRYEFEYFKNLNYVPDKISRNHIVTLEGNFKF